MKTKNEIEKQIKILEETAKEENSAELTHTDIMISVLMWVIDDSD